MATLPSKTTVPKTYINNGVNMSELYKNVSAASPIKQSVDAGVTLDKFKQAQQSQQSQNATQAKNILNSVAKQNPSLFTPAPAPAPAPAQATPSPKKAFINPVIGNQGQQSFGMAPIRQSDLKNKAYGYSSTAQPLGAQIGAAVSSGDVSKARSLIAQNYGGAGKQTQGKQQSSEMVHNVDGKTLAKDQYQSSQQARYLKAILDQDYDLVSRLEADAALRGWELPLNAMKRQNQTEQQKTFTNLQNYDRVSDQPVPQEDVASKPDETKKVNTPQEDAWEQVRKRDESVLSNLDAQIKQAETDRDFALKNQLQNQKVMFQKLSNESFLKELATREQMAGRGILNSGMLSDALTRLQMSSGQQLKDYMDKQSLAGEKTLKDFQNAYNKAQGRKEKILGAQSGDVDKIVAKAEKDKQAQAKAEADASMDQTNMLLSVFKGLASAGGRISPELVVPLIQSVLPGTSTEAAYRILNEAQLTPTATNQLSTAAGKMSDQTGFVTGLDLKPVTINGKKVLTLKGNKLELDRDKFNEVVEQNKKKNDQAWAKISVSQENLRLANQKADAAFQQIVTSNMFKSLGAVGDALSQEIKAYDSDMAKYRSIYEKTTVPADKEKALQRMENAQSEKFNAIGTLQSIVTQTTQQTVANTNEFAKWAGSFGYNFGTPQSK